MAAPLAIYASIDYISAKTQISALIRRLIYGLLTMAMIVGPLMGVKDLGKVRNRRVVKSQIVLIINVGRTLVLGLPPKWPPH